MFIKRRATGTGKIEVHVASAASGFQQVIQHAASALSVADDGFGDFTLADVDRDGRPDLVYFRKQSTGTGTIEVHVTSAASGYQQFLQHATTALTSTESAFGDFTMTDHNRDGRLDLVFIKSRKPGTNTIEVHILGG